MRLHAEHATYADAAKSARALSLRLGHETLVKMSGGAWGVFVPAETSSSGVAASKQPSEVPASEEDAALQKALKGEEDLALHRCSYLSVCRLYTLAAKLGSAQAYEWLKSQGQYVPDFVPSDRPRWGEGFMIDENRGSSHVDREAYYDGYRDDG